jgi:DNA-directed RNA polymerase specialized sigma24 family protein
MNQLYERYLSDPAQFEAEFWSAVLSHLKRATKDEDIAADAVLKVVAGLKNYRHDGRFPQWLNTIARTTIADSRAKSKEDPLAPEVMERLVSSLPAPDVLRLDLEPIADCIDRMLCEQVLETGSIAEAASACNLTVAAARKRLRRLGNKLGNACPLLR